MTIRGIKPQEVCSRNVSILIITTTWGSGMNTVSIPLSRVPLPDQPTRGHLSVRLHLFGCLLRVSLASH